MEEYKVGGKITLGENETYIIVDIIEFEGTNYYFCCTSTKPIIPVVFERAEFDGEVFVKKVEDLRIIKYVTQKIIE